MFASLFYNFKLKAYLKKRNIPRRFLSLKDAKCVIVAFESDNYASFIEREKLVNRYFSEDVKLFYVVYMHGKKDDDFNDTALNHLIFYQNDLNFKRIPKADLVARIDDLNPDVFVNFEDDESQVIDFIEAISKAKMRIAYSSKQSNAELMIDASSKMGTKQFLENLFSVWGKFNLS